MTRFSESYTMLHHRFQWQPVVTPVTPKRFFTSKETTQGCPWHLRTLDPWSLTPIFAAKNPTKITWPVLVRSQLFQSEDGLVLLGKSSPETHGFYTIKWLFSFPVQILSHHPILWEMEWSQQQTVEPEPKAMARSAFVILMVAQLPCFLVVSVAVNLALKIGDESPNNHLNISRYQGVSNHWIQIQPNNQSWGLYIKPQIIQVTFMTILALKPVEPWAMGYHHFRKHPSIAGHPGSSGRLWRMASTLSAISRGR